MADRKEVSIYANNHKHRGHTIGYMCTVAFDCILYYLKANTDKNTKDTTLQEFQSYIVQYIDDFIPTNNTHGATSYREHKKQTKGSNK